MTVKVRVVDRLNRPVEGARVLVSWDSGGHSDRRTDNNGIADLGCSPGTAKRVTIDDREVDTNFYLKDGMTPYQHPRK